VIVLDASVTIDYLLHFPPHVFTIAARIHTESPDLAAPHLIDAEVAQALRRHVRAGHISARRAGQALEDLLALPILRYPHAPFLARAFNLRDNATMYDALYIVLAEALRAPLLTRDAALTAIPGHRARVECLR
jgi:predicted nucleic acid-binding protein